MHSFRKISLPSCVLAKINIVRVVSTIIYICKTMYDSFGQSATFGTSPMPFMHHVYNNSLQYHFRLLLWVGNFRSIWSWRCFIMTWVVFLARALFMLYTVWTARPSLPTMHYSCLGTGVMVTNRALDSLVNLLLFRFLCFITVVHNFELIWLLWLRVNF